MHYSRLSLDSCAYLSAHEMEIFLPWPWCELASAIRSLQVCANDITPYGYLLPRRVKVLYTKDSYQEVTFWTKTRSGDAGGILLTGPAGAGKTTVVKTVEAHLPSSVITTHIKASSLSSSSVTSDVGPADNDATINRLRTKIRGVAAGNNHPLFIIIDDADCLAGEFTRSLISLLEDPSLSLCVLLIATDASALAEPLRRSHHFQREIKMQLLQLTCRQQTIQRLLDSVTFSMYIYCCTRLTSTRFSTESRKQKMEAHRSQKRSFSKLHW